MKMQEANGVLATETKNNVKPPPIQKKCANCEHEEDIQAKSEGQAHEIGTEGESLPESVSNVLI